MNRLLSTFAVAALAVTSFAIPASADTVSATGSFTGASEHITTGGVSIVKTDAGGAIVILDADFSLDGAPDPKVGFGKDGQFVAASDLGELTSKDGLQVYVVPASVNVDDYNEVYIWCEQFSVPLGVATLG